jgi:hypothetical protein
VRPRPGLTWYNGSKGAAIVTSRSMAAELAPDNIRVNVINPVAGETGLLAEFMGGDTPELRARFVASIPLGRRRTFRRRRRSVLSRPTAASSSPVRLEVDGGAKRVPPLRTGCHWPLVGGGAPANARRSTARCDRVNRWAVIAIPRRWRWMVFANAHCVSHRDQSILWVEEGLRFLRIWLTFGCRPVPASGHRQRHLPDALSSRPV